MNKASFLNVSNTHNILVNFLHDNLFKLGSFSTKRIVIVPSTNVKNWIMLNIAKNKKVSCGLEFFSIEQFIQKFFERYNKNKKIDFLSSIKLQLTIEEKIINILQKKELYTDEEKKLFSPLINYFENENINDIKSLKRFIFLCENLSNIFMEYSTYAKESPSLKEINCWQTFLYNEIRKENVFFSDILDIEINGIDDDLQIHIFGFSFFEKIYNDWFYKLSEKIPVFHYVLSPTMHFVEDMYSKYEKQSLIGHYKRNNKKASAIEDLNSYFKSQNSLLSNFIRLGKKHFSHFYEDCVYVDAYDYYKEEFDDWTNENSNKYSLLNSLQKDFLYCKNSEEIFYKANDKSILINKTSSKIRELEVLREYIIETIFKSEGSIKPSDIYVMSMNIQEYAPYIHFIFNKKSFAYDYKISDLQLLYESDVAQGIMTLFKKNLDKEDVFKLLDNKNIQNKWGFTAEDINLIRKWVDKAEIRHELDDNSIENNNSWSAGLDRLLYSLVFSIDENTDIKRFKFFHPVQGIDFSDYSTLNKFFLFFHALKEDFKQMKSMTAGKWANFIEQLIDKHFFYNDEDKNIFSYLEAFVSQLKQMDEKINEDIDFLVIQRHLESLLFKKNHVYNHSLCEAIHFCEFNGKNILPAKVICILGLDDNVISYDVVSSSNLLNNKKDIDYCPSSIDKIRYFYLMSLISAKDNFYCSYVNTSSDGKEAFPSVLLQETLSYLDNYYRIQDKKPSDMIVVQHPAIGFHKKYFSNDEKYFCSSEKFYLMAKSHYKEEKKDFSLFLKPSDEPSFDEEIIIDIKDLNSFAKNPLRHYCNKTLNFYLDHLEIDKDIRLSFLEMHLIKTSFLKKPIEEILIKLEKQGKMPLGFMKDVAKEDVEKTINDMSLSMKDMNIKKEDVFDVCLDEKVKEKIIDGNGNHTYPPIELTIKNSKVKIIGTIFNVVNDGFLDFSEKNFKNIIKQWPSILILSHLRNEGTFLYFLKKKKKQKIDINRSYDLLSNYVGLYERSKKIDFPFVNEWIDPILSRDEKKLKKQIDQSINGTNQYNDPYIEWAFNNKNLPSANNLIAAWSAQFNDVFYPVMKNEIT